MRRRASPAVVLALVLLATFAANAWFAAHPSSSYQSSDERSYGKLAVNLADQHRYGDASTGMSQPLHWPPGAPLLFALAYTVSGSPAASRESADIPAAYWAQAVVSTGTAAAAALLVWLLAGAWPGVVAGLLVGLYPPLVLSSGEQISEPLGAFLLTAALLALAVATRGSAGGARPRRLWAWPLAGALLGLCVLTRTDLLPVPFLLAGLGGLVALWRARRGSAAGERPGVVRAVAGPALLLAAAVVVIVPWTAYASHRDGNFVPVTKGSASALFVGTYLPGNGTTVGMKRALAPALKARRPALRGRGAMDIDAADYLALVASRHPELSRDAAVSLEGKNNLKRYVREDPAGFALMMANKVQRMWTRYARGGARHTSWEIRVWHILLVGAAVAGIVLGLRRRRDAVLGAVVVTVLFSTAIHTLVVSQARYNLPLMPALIAAGVVGWAWTRADRAGRTGRRPRRAAAAV